MFLSPCLDTSAMCTDKRTQVTGKTQCSSSKAIRSSLILKPPIQEGPGIPRVTKEGILIKIPNNHLLICKYKERRAHRGFRVSQLSAPSPVTVVLNLRRLRNHKPQPPMSHIDMFSLKHQLMAIT